MNTKHFISLLVSLSLLAVTVLVVREANATASGISTVDPATRYYTAWAKAIEAEANQMDSATRSYIAQAKAVSCGVDATYAPNLDSATRSYIAWGFASDRGDLCR